mgnify:CR=1 FL=1
MGRAPIITSFMTTVYACVCGNRLGGGVFGRVSVGVFCCNSFPFKWLAFAETGVPKGGFAGFRHSYTIMRSGSSKGLRTMRPRSTTFSAQAFAERVEAQGVLLGVEEAPELPFERMARVRPIVLRRRRARRRR